MNILEAAECGDVDELKKCIAAGEDVNTTDKNGVDVVCPS